MKSHWVRHHGQRVFIADFSHFDGDAVALQAEVDAIKETFKQELPNTINALTYVEGTFANPETLRVLGSLLPYSNKYVRKRALVGVFGFRKHFVESLTNLVGSVRFKPFDNLDQALDWITEE